MTQLFIVNVCLSYNMFEELQLFSTFQSQEWIIPCFIMYKSCLIGSILFSLSRTLIFLQYIV